MVIRVHGEGFNKIITYIDNCTRINQIGMADISDHEAGHEEFWAEVSESHAKSFHVYPAGLRLPVIAMHYGSYGSPLLMVLGPDETRIETHTWSTNMLCCGDESRNAVVQRAMRLLPGDSSGSGRRGADVGKQRDALWRMARTAVHKFRDGEMKKLDSRLGVV